MQGVLGLFLGNKAQEGPTPVDDAVAQNTTQLAQKEAAEKRAVPGSRLNAAASDVAGPGPVQTGAAPEEERPPKQRKTGLEKLMQRADIFVGDKVDDGKEEEEEEDKESPAAVGPAEDRPLRKVLQDEKIPKQLSSLYLFWIGLESNVTEPITLPSTEVFAESKGAFEKAKVSVRHGSAPYDEIYIWLMGEEMIPKQLCATVRSVLNTIEQRRALLHARHIPFWDLFAGQDAVFLSKWITAQHLYNVQSNRSWSGRRENHQALAQITRDAAEYFCTRP